MGYHQESMTGSNVWKSKDTFPRLQTHNFSSTPSKTQGRHVNWRVYDGNDAMNISTVHIPSSSRIAAAKGHV